VALKNNIAGVVMIAMVVRCQTFAFHKLRVHLTIGATLAGLHAQFFATKVNRFVDKEWIPGVVVQCPAGVKWLQILILNALGIVPPCVDLKKSNAGVGWMPLTVICQTIVSLLAKNVVDQCKTCL